MELTASVGQNGQNVEKDVKLVQQLLQSAGCDPGPIDGCCGPMTIAAITKFQGRLLSEPDGLIEPGKTTWNNLLRSEGLGASHDVGSWTGDSSRWSQEKKLQSL